MDKCIEINNVSYSYGERQVLEDISLSLRRGTIHGLLGPNGAGKTTTMKLIIQVLKPKSGQILVDGEFKHNQSFISQKMGFLLDNLPLYEEMTINEFLNFLAEIRGVEKSETHKAVQYCLKALDLDDVKNRLISNLSKGYKQRVAIAQALIHNPEIVILDEPTLGLDPQSVIEIRNLLLNLKKDHSLLISSHLLHEMSLICDDISILSRGKIIETGKLSTITKKLAEQQVIETHVRADEKVIRELFRELTFIEGFDLENIESTTHIKIKVNKLDKDYRPEIVKKMVEKNIEVLKIDKNEKSLEDIFMGFTQV